MKKKQYPRGKPEEDQEKIKAWWAEEMQRCGISGEVAVEYSPCDQEVSQKSLGKRLFDKFMGENEVSEAHMYHSLIPGAPWPLEALVMTTAEGTVTQIIYHARLQKKFAGELLFKHRPAVMGSKVDIEGEDADRFKSQKKLIKTLKASLSFRYDIPLFGFHSGEQTYEHGPATITIVPDENGTSLTANTTVFAESKFVGKNFSLGLDRIIEAIREIEQTA
jgi:hypothetical protein